MMRKLFSDRLLKAEGEMKRAGRNILYSEQLFGNLVNVLVTNVRLELLPPYGTSLVQLLYQRGINSVKAPYLTGAVTFRVS
ncbi:hypothetical protein HPB48_021040 [Haemaphysalis longicornis]|uniref:Uncharacterized protein n=1 Tax=Haemaphysalis longicornis TaxID=44386 RepID=A0A9J6GKZ2_HAELO|nr:hypothetical protein HPB48_021040 [Haemaphysalis longicornis]